METSSHPLVLALARLAGHASPSERLAAALDAYAQDTGVSLSRPPTATEVAAARRWWVEADLHSDVAVGWTVARRVQPWAHPDAGATAHWLQQAPCWRCETLPEGGPSAVSFAVRVAPFSAQSTASKKLKGLKEKIAASLMGRFANAGDWSGVAVCASLVAVTGHADRTKDADNLVKGVLDAVQGAIYDNDRNIQHLSVARIRHDGRAGHYMLMLRPVYPYLSDTLDHTFRMNWQRDGISYP